MPRGKGALRLPVRAGGARGADASAEGGDGRREAGGGARAGGGGRAGGPVLYVPVLPVHGAHHQPSDHRVPVREQELHEIFLPVGLIPNLFVMECMY